jgi:hypothetical protein
MPVLGIWLAIIILGIGSSTALFYPYLPWDSRFWSSQILGTSKQAERWLREFTEGNYYLGGAVNPRNADMIAEDTGLDLVFTGDKFFSTGSRRIRSDKMVIRTVGANIHSP